MPRRKERLIERVAITMATKPMILRVNPDYDCGSLRILLVIFYVSLVHIHSIQGQNTNLQTSQETAILDKLSSASIFRVPVTIQRTTPPVLPPSLSLGSKNSIMDSAVLFDATQNFDTMSKTNQIIASKIEDNASPSAFRDISSPNQLLPTFAGQSQKRTLRNKIQTESKHSPESTKSIDSLLTDGMMKMNIFTTHTKSNLAPSGTTFSVDNKIRSSGNSDIASSYDISETSKTVHSSKTVSSQKSSDSVNSVRIIFSNNVPSGQVIKASSTHVREMSRSHAKKMSASMVASTSLDIEKNILHASESTIRVSGGHVDQTSLDRFSSISPSFNVDMSSTATFGDGTVISDYTASTQNEVMKTNSVALLSTKFNGIQSSPLPITKDYSREHVHLSELSPLLDSDAGLHATKKLDSLSLVGSGESRETITSSSSQINATKINRPHIEFITSAAVMEFSTSKMHASSLNTSFLSPDASESAAFVSGDSTNSYHSLFSHLSETQKISYILPTSKMETDSWTQTQGDQSSAIILPSWRTEYDPHIISSEISMSNTGYSTPLSHIQLTTPSLPQSLNNVKATSSSLGSFSSEFMPSSVIYMTNSKEISKNFIAIHSHTSNSEEMFRTNLPIESIENEMEISVLTNKSEKIITESFTLYTSSSDFDYVHRNSYSTNIYSSTKPLESSDTRRTKDTSKLRQNLPMSTTSFVYPGYFSKNGNTSTFLLRISQSQIYPKTTSAIGTFEESDISVPFPTEIASNIGQSHTKTKIHKTPSTMSDYYSTLMQTYQPTYKGKTSSYGGIYLPSSANDITARSRLLIPTFSSTHTSTSAAHTTPVSSSIIQATKTSEDSSSIENSDLNTSGTFSIKSSVSNRETSLSERLSFRDIHTDSLKKPSSPYQTITSLPEYSTTSDIKTSLRDTMLASSTYSTSDSDVIPTVKSEASFIDADSIMTETLGNNAMSSSRYLSSSSVSSSIPSLSLSSDEPVIHDKTSKASTIPQTSHMSTVDSDGLYTIFREATNYYSATEIPFTRNLITNATAFPSSHKEETTVFVIPTGIATTISMSGYNNETTRPLTTPETYIDSSTYKTSTIDIYPKITITSQISREDKTETKSESETTKFPIFASNTVTPVDKSASANATDVISKQSSITDASSKEITTASIYNGGFTDSLGGMTSSSRRSEATTSDYNIVETTSVRSEDTFSGIHTQPTVTTKPTILPGDATLFSTDITTPDTPSTNKTVSGDPNYSYATTEFRHTTDISTQMTATSGDRNYTLSDTSTRNTPLNTTMSWPVNDTISQEITTASSGTYYTVSKSLVYVFTTNTTPGMSMATNEASSQAMTTLSGDINITTTDTSTPITVVTNVTDVRNVMTHESMLNTTVPTFSGMSNGTKTTSYVTAEGGVTDTIPTQQTTTVEVTTDSISSVETRETDTVQSTTLDAFTGTTFSQNISTNLPPVTQKHENTTLTMTTQTSDGISGKVTVQTTTIDQLSTMDQLSTTDEMSTTDVMSTRDQMSTTDQISTTDHMSITDQISTKDRMSTTDQISTTDHMSTMDQLSTTDEMSTIDQISTTNQISTTDQMSTTGELSTIDQLSTRDQLSTTDELSTMDRRTTTNPSIVTAIPTTTTRDLSQVKEEYWNEMVILVTMDTNISSPAFKNMIEENLVNVFEFAFEKQMNSRRRKRAAGDVKVKVLSVDRQGQNEEVLIQYVVSKSGVVLDKQAVASALNRVSSAQMTSLMGFGVRPVTQTTTTLLPTTVETSTDNQLWIIGVVLGSIAAVVAIVILILIIYMRFCSVPPKFSPSSEDPVTRPEKLGDPPYHVECSHINELTQKNGVGTPVFRSPKEQRSLSADREDAEMDNPVPNQTITLSDEVNVTDVEKSSIEYENMAALHSADTLPQSTETQPSVMSDDGTESIAANPSSVTSSEHPSSTSQQNLSRLLPNLQRGLYGAELITRAAVERQRNKQRLRERRKMEKRDARRRADKPPRYVPRDIIRTPYSGTESQSDDHLGMSNDGYSETDAYVESSEEVTGCLDHAQLIQPQEYSHVSSINHGNTRIFHMRRIRPCNRIHPSPRHSHKHKPNERKAHSSDERTFVRHVHAKDIASDMADSDSVLATVRQKNGRRSKDSLRLPKSTANQNERRRLSLGNGEKSRRTKVTKVRPLSSGVPNHTKGGQHERPVDIFTTSPFRSNPPSPPSGPESLESRTASPSSHTGSPQIGHVNEWKIHASDVQPKSLAWSDYSMVQGRRALNDNQSNGTFSENEEKLFSDVSERPSSNIEMQDITSSVTTYHAVLGKTAGFADEYEVIQSLQPGVSPAPLIKSIREELQRLAEKTHDQGTSSC